MIRFGVEMLNKENELIAAGEAMAEFPLVKT